MEKNGVRKGDFVNEKLKEPEKYIPLGIYCGNCPFYLIIPPVRSNHKNVWCAFLKKSNSQLEKEGYLSLLWDGCKECGINLGADAQCKYCGAIYEDGEDWWKSLSDYRAFHKCPCGFELSAEGKSILEAKNNLYKKWDEICSFST